MASKSGMGYTKNDVPLLIERARAMCFPIEFPSTVNADWLIEGGLGSHQWITKNNGKEYFKDGWRNTKNLFFDVQLPDGSSLCDQANRRCFDALQKWCFAYRSGWLGPDPTAKHWHETCRFGITLTSWMYLRKDQFFPQEHGFDLLTKADLKMLFEELTVDGWVTALKIIERSFTAIYSLAYNEPPDAELIAQLPYVPDAIVEKVTSAVEANNLFIRTNKRDQRLISRVFLAEMLGTIPSRFVNLSVRTFLRQFEVESGSPLILVPGKAYGNYPRSTEVQSLEDFEPESPSKQAMLLHATHCMSFLLGSKMPSIGIPDTGFAHDSIRELMESWAPNTHRTLMPLDDSLKLLNEAARWITEYGNGLISFLEDYMSAREEAFKKLEPYGYATEYLKRRAQDVYQEQRALAVHEEVWSQRGGIFSKLGLGKAVKQNGRDVIPNDLTLNQALFSMIGACAYAIGMMKPLRDNELADIPFDCLLRHNKTNGCWAEFPIEKSEKQGHKRYVIRPIPYFTYLAMQLMQRLAKVTAKFFDGGAVPPRIFYFGSGEGFEAPLKAGVALSINRCMDIFCDCVDLPLDEHGARKYFRVHELRKFFLVWLSLDDPEHGLECGAWMAGHRNKEFIKAYTEATASGAEVSAWAAEQVEVKLLAMDSDSRQNRPSAQDDLKTLYNELKLQLRVSRIAGLPEAKFRSYVKNALSSGRYRIRLLTLDVVDGSQKFDFGVFLEESEGAKG